MTMKPQGSERRRHVRVRPAPDFDVSMAFSDDGIVWIALQTVDISLGGVGVLTTDDLSGKRSGDPLSLRAHLGDRDLTLRGTIRHVGASVCGIEFDTLDGEQAALLRAAVAELMERGSLA
jgi:hypothetical protein